MTHGDGPMMVLAGPGSGKTFVLTQRIYYLITSLGISPDQILVITFTRLAANEMKARFLQLCRGRYYPVTFATFHSFFFSVLKTYLHYQTSDLLTDGEKRELLRFICRNYPETESADRELAGSLLEEIEEVKKKRLAIKEYESYHVSTALFRRIYQDYLNILNMRHKLDFDDLMLRCHDLLRERGAILKELRMRYRYLLIDEFQDIEQEQFDIMKMIAYPSNHLFVVGDDDQSIYGFRGSDPMIMQQFEEEYPAAKRIILQKNYRSDASVIQASQKLIRENKFRIDKQIYPVHPFGERVFLDAYENQYLEDLAVAEKITQNLALGDAHTVAVICRTMQGYAGIAIQLRLLGVSYRVSCDVKNPYDCPETEVVSSILQFTLGDHRRGLFLKFMNVPMRYIRRDDLPEMIDLNRLQRFYAGSRTAESIGRLREDLSELGKMSPYAAVCMIRYGFAAEEALRNTAEEGRNIWDLMLDAARNEQSLSAYVAHLDQLRHLDPVGEKTSSKQSDDSGQGDVKVSLLTMHASKGLEFDAVYLPGLNEKMMPHHRALTDTAIEEERRLLYVAMTRARHRLNLSYHQSGAGSSAYPSRFLSPLADITGSHCV